MGCMYVVSGPGDKKYIGITLRPLADRWSEHQKNNSGCLSLLRAIKKYGASRFTTRTLVVSSDWDYLCWLERRAILRYGTLGPRGYNLTLGGDGVVGLADDAKKRHRRNTSLGSKSAWDNSTTRANRAIVFNSPEFKRKHAEATARGVRAAYDRPEVRQNLVASMTPERKARISRRVSELWADPEYRANQLAKRRSQPARTAESKKAQGEKMRTLIAARKAAGTYWR